jgi:nicotinamidase-related amidase
MMKNVLVIIDMQPFFYASRGKKVLDENIKQIEDAISKDHNIIVLEYCDFGKTHIRIKKALRGYKQVEYITKYNCSGSKPLVKYFKTQKIWPKEVKFMGVNTGACVKETVLNFHHHIKRNNKKTKIKVIRNGCRCDHYNNLGDFSHFEKRQIEVV